MTSNGFFAGSCIGVVFLVMSLELLRRLSKEYDRYIIRNAMAGTTFSLLDIASCSGARGPKPGADVGVRDAESSGLAKASEENETRTLDAKKRKIFRPNIAQQAVRAALHMLTFTVAYFVMLLAMYYNGYFIICIIIGAFLGSFAFSWESLELR